MSRKEKVSEILFETFNVPALYLANQGVLSLYSSGLISGRKLAACAGRVELDGGGPEGADRVQILFETFNVPALYLANQGVLSLYSSGLISGTSVESGEGMTFFVPVIEGCPLRQSTMQMDIAGQDITLYLLRLLSEKGNSLIALAQAATRAPDPEVLESEMRADAVVAVLSRPHGEERGEREYIRALKEKCCHVALDFDKEKEGFLLSPHPGKHQLPDGREIELGQETFLCMEALFQTDLIGRNSLGAHMTAFRCISSCSPALWKALFGHVMLSGGTGSCIGLKSRMQRELSALVSPLINVKVCTCPYSVYSAWVGGSILCSLSTFKDMWVTSDDYKDMGASAVSRRAL
ncbi:PREDICTED: actin-like [Miniopterus natalensis]|uniref:actin-like n=1 Tax=Miniopterus natalensis TaxID=291302 RepID=UPI0007A6FB3A|nr:PREDICTED: actin-like [Miniopterus natalensis]